MPDAILIENKNKIAQARDLVRQLMELAENTLRQSDLKRLINKNKYNLEDCLSRVSEGDYEGIQTCINDN